MRVLTTSIASLVLVVALSACSTSGSSTVEPINSDAAVAASATPETARTLAPAKPSASPRLITSPSAVPTPAIPSATPSQGPYPPVDLPRLDAHGSWGFLQSFDEVIEVGDVFIVGEVLTIVAADTDEELPTSDSRVRMTDVSKGDLQTDTVVTVQQTGGVIDRTEAIENQKRSPGPLPPEAPPGVEPLPPVSIPPLMLLEFDEDPLFLVGERVALALEWNPRLKLYQVVAGPQGRFRIDEQDRVHPMVPGDPATASLDGLTIDELLARVEAIAAD